ncbi:preprotein translocase subunit SecY [Saccharopolyspora hirsuta]|uniref:Protein translocase subunit SecY n=1 Tax=Saccharopolyspora hirsuta TaxID=1837 RepID=A0A5M7BT78_SACHI|nr:preprotein translocase subunit SecY [Saccharopolyspora hirsuta]KAA5833436.1 preprotein translocase subunit SecY [Saccharopolyspora hirsuta]MBF6507887.1 preprotein translocase subunit SecY [Nocardia farcinica]
MLGAFRSALATPDLRRKILFTLGMVVLYRLGATIPSPGVSYPNIQQCIEQIEGSGSQSVYSLLNLFSGGALLQLSVLSLGIMPYITASIIIQLLQVVIPRFEQLKKEGQSGQAKLTQYTRYLTIALAILQGTGVVALAVRGQLFQGCSVSPIPDDSVLNLITIVIVMTAGAAVLMWMGELITERGIGNGMSLLIFVSIAARIPAEGGAILQSHGGLVFAVVCAFAVVIIGTVVFIEQAQRRIPVQYAKRMIGRRMYGGTSTYLPLKVNQAGVIPVIFGSSLLYLPQLIGQLAGNQDTWWARFIQTYIVDPSSWVHILLYMALIVFFAYFYVSITFNPEERADDMKKFGGFIPGIRPGRPTAEYLNFVLSRITLPGALYLGIIAILPNFFLGITGGQGQNQNFPFGGTAVLIMVNVGLDTVKQIESQLTQRKYEGFLR